MRRTGPVFAAVLLVSLVVPAAADEPETEEGETPEEQPQEEPETTPWSEGVSAEQRARAEGLLEEGNRLFLEAEHRQALKKYREAIESWDHPAIRFNIVRTLIYLDRPVEAYENLEAALRFGPAPLEEQVYQEAKNYERLLRGQIAVLEVRCQQEGAQITIDGEAFLSCPGSRSKRLRPGSHSIVGKKRNFLTLSETLVLLPGKEEVFEAKLVSLDEATVKVQRWKAWKPWAVTGGGAALAGIGVLLQFKAKADYDQYDAEIDEFCPNGCAAEDIPGSTRELKSQARLENGVAISTMIAGGAVVAAGVTMVIFNRPRSVIPEEAPPTSGPKVTPAVSAGGFGLQLTQRF